MRLCSKSTQVVEQAITSWQLQLRKRSITNALQKLGYTTGLKNQATKGPCDLCICLEHRAMRRVACFWKRLSRICALRWMALGVAGFHLFGSFALPETKNFVSQTSINESMFFTIQRKQRAAGKHTIQHPDIKDTEMQTHSKLSKCVMSASNYMRFFMKQPSTLTHGSLWRCIQPGCTNSIVIIVAAPTHRERAPHRKLIS
jgi:hypothetical protein